ncbi:MAG: baeRF2 domain-containing protein [Mycobacteriales bacterium]
MKLHQLAPLYRLPGPVVTWYLPSEPAEDSATQLEIAWKNGLAELADRGVDDATIEALSTVRRTTGEPAGTRVLVASGGKVQLDQHLPPPLVSPELSVGPLPRLLPFMAAMGSRRAHVVVLTDREGADVIAYPATGGEPEKEVSAQTAEWPVHKTGTGGWAAKRFEASVEESWERSAERVATLVDDVARHADPALVVGSGDETAITLLRDHLPSALQESFVAVPGGGRHADGGNEEVSRRVAEAVAAHAASEEVAVLERFAQANGRHEGAADGVAAVVSALQKAQVDTLLVSAASWRESDRMLGYGPEPTQLAADDADLQAMAVDEPSRGPLIDVVLRAALGTDAEVVAVSDAAEAAPRDGLGALLRFEARPDRPATS